jgi:vitamin B12 transporter
LAAFKRDIRNLIVFYTDTITYASEYINRDRQNDYGFEMESDVAITKLLNWSTNVSFVTGKGIEGKAKVDNLYRRPKVIFNTAFTLEPTETLTITTSFKYVGSRMKSPYDAGPEKLPAYYTIDFSIAYDLVKKVRLFADVHNITAQRYYDIPGYNSKLLNGVGGIMLKL